MQKRRSEKACAKTCLHHSFTLDVDCECADVRELAKCHRKVFSDLEILDCRAPDGERSYGETQGRYGRVVDEISDRVGKVKCDSTALVYESSVLLDRVLSYVANPSAHVSQSVDVVAIFKMFEYQGP